MTPPPRPTLPYFQTKLRPKELKENIFETPPLLSQGLDDCPPFSEGLDLPLHSITCSQLHAVTHNKEKVGSSSHAVMALLQSTMECFSQFALQTDEAWF